jgi:S-DNA-T family DNA segregation ATPase FtsK/SpoIIIE
MEPRLDRSTATGYQQQRPGPALDMGYNGPQDFAPPSQQGHDDGYDDGDDWDDNWDDDGAPQSVPVGIAPPELDRPSSQSGNRAATNETAKARPAGASGRGKGKRMVRSGQGNLFTRKDEYQFPSLDILSEPESLGPNAGLTADQLEHNARLLEGVLSDFGIRGEIIKVRPGPVVTLYELEPAPGIKSSRVIGLADDIARSMSAISARVAVVPGRNAIGIELPNARRETVYLRRRILRNPRPSCPSALARISQAIRSSLIWPACPTCSSPGPPARANLFRSIPPSCRCSIDTVRMNAV